MEFNDARNFVGGKVLLIGVLEGTDKFVLASDKGIEIQDRLDLQNILDGFKKETASDFVSRVLLQLLLRVCELEAGLEKLRKQVSE